MLQHARGRVLDVGAGTAANLPHYPSSVEHVVLLDPHPGMLARAAAKAASLHVSAEVQLDRAERLPFADASFDTVVCTLSLCTVNDVPKALDEAARVLRPAGPNSWFWSMSAPPTPVWPAGRIVWYLYSACSQTAATRTATR